MAPRSCQTPRSTASTPNTDARLLNSASCDFTCWWVDDTLAAVRMAVEVENTLWELKIGYDEQFAKWSPGVVLTHETIRHAFEHGLSGLEFLGRAEVLAEALAS